MRAARAARPEQRVGLLRAALGAAVGIVVWLGFALLFSVAVEIAGMVWWWPEQGAGHSAAMLARELAYLDADFPRSLWTDDPHGFAHAATARAYRVAFQWTRLEAFGVWLARPAQPGEPPLLSRWRAIYQQLTEYFEAAATISQLFAARLAVLTLALPAFGLFALVGLSVGLAQRDLRRWGGGREHAFVYHHAKRWIAPLLLAAWVVYLGLPVSLHPSYVVLPFAALMALAIAVAAATFKKYL